MGQNFITTNQQTNPATTIDAATAESGATGTGAGTTTSGASTTAGGASQHVVFHGTAAITHDQSYDYALNYSLAINGPVRTSIDGNTPGQVSIGLPVTRNVSVTNTTPNGYSGAPGAVSTVFLAEFFKSSRPICNVQSSAIEDLPLGHGAAHDPDWQQRVLLPERA
jgi:hypothetical protein